MRILVLGASGLLGRAMMRVLPQSSGFKVLGTVRTEATRSLCAEAFGDKLAVLPDALDDKALKALLRDSRAEAVINCVAPGRDALAAADSLQVISLCALLPHRIAAVCAESGARLIHISTDGVFSGRRGGYSEDDEPDARDLYGMSKYLGEVQQPHAVTIRTSIIGHELRNGRGLLEWFLRQEKICTCYSRAVFSGFPAVVLAEIFRDVILPRAELHGLYHVASEPITKCELLRLIANEYGKTIEIVPDGSLAIDRSLNPQRFRDATGYVAPAWPAMIRTMRSSSQSEKERV